MYSMESIFNLRDRRELTESGNHSYCCIITRTEDMYAANAWYMNEAFWESLTDAQKKGIEDALEATNAWSFEQSKASEQSLIDQMVSEGATYSATFADRETLRSQAIDAVKKLEASGKWSSGLVDAIQAIK